MKKLFHSICLESQASVITDISRASMFWIIIKFFFKDCLCMIIVTANTSQMFGSNHFATC